MRNRFVLGALVLTTATLAPSARGEDFRWTGSLGAGKVLEIKGVNGGIDARPASGNQAEVTAHKSARRSNPEDVEIKVVEHADGVTICAVYPTPSGSRTNECQPGSGGRMNTATTTSAWSSPSAFPRGSASGPHGQRRRGGRRPDRRRRGPFRERQGDGQQLRPDPGGDGEREHHGRDGPRRRGRATSS
jgi:hypothetical protein